MLHLQNDEITAFQENDILAFPFNYILAYSQYFVASKSDLKWLRFSFNGKMSKQDTTGQYWSILSNIWIYLTILENI